MSDLHKFVGTAMVTVVLTVTAMLGFGSGGGDTKYVTATPPAPMALAADVRCPSPPRTGGAIFVDLAKGVVHSDGNGQRTEYLNCDYAGEWSYTLRADGIEQLAKYKGDGSPYVLTTTGEINRALADLH